jgi:hypothetical protein
MVVLRFADIGGIVEHHCFHSMEDDKLIIRINFNYKKQVLLTLREHPISPRLFGGVRVHVHRERTSVFVTISFPI